ncbi:40428_t:CDS:2 [Gigaspora margarita]|uniref:40428_t:CDS:1 n=1 Tax=Gigaspora margarita TaxID=4874 RepID=A0ABN7UGE2_GIGMA|nr:40428_t:CDS:2 [Gigaspora margarita]
MKKSLNLALDLGCEKEFINIKLCSRPPNKQIKLASETNLDHINLKHSTINQSS